MAAAWRFMHSGSACKMIEFRSDQTGGQRRTAVLLMGLPVLPTRRDRCPTNPMHSKLHECLKNLICRYVGSVARPTDNGDGLLEICLSVKSMRTFVAGSVPHLWSGTLRDRTASGCCVPQTRRAVYRREPRASYSASLRG